MDEQVLEAPPLHSETVEGGRESDAPERRRQCDMVSQRAQGRASADGAIARGPDQARTRARVAEVRGHDRGCVSTFTGI